MMKRFPAFVIRAHISLIAAVYSSTLPATCNARKCVRNLYPWGRMGTDAFIKLFFGVMDVPSLFLLTPLLP